MTGVKRYVLDSNIFIQAHQTYYAFDTCPGFWMALRRQHEAKRVFSIDKVKSELLAMEDQLRAWANSQAPATFFKGTADRNVADAFREIANWVQSQSQFTTAAKEKFLRVADGWVVAYAKVNGLVVVTHEAYSPEAKREVLIPNVCIEFGVEYCNTFEMLKDLNVQLILRKRRAGGRS